MSENEQYQAYLIAAEQARAEADMNRQRAESTLIQQQQHNAMLEAQMQELNHRVNAQQDTIHAAQQAAQQSNGGGQPSAVEQQIQQLMSVVGQQAETVNQLINARVAAFPGASDPENNPNPRQSTERVDSKLISQNLKIKDIPLFAGHRNGTIITFLNAATARFKYLASMQQDRPIPELIKILYMVGRFPQSSSSEAWWNNETQRKPAEQWTYQEFFDALKAQYTRPHEGLMLRMKYKAIVRKGLTGEAYNSVQRFTDAANDAANLCFPSVDNATRIADYYQVMPPEIQRAILLDFTAEGEWHEWQLTKLTQYCITYASKGVGTRTFVPRRNVGDPMQVDAMSFKKPHTNSAKQKDIPPEQKQWPPTVTPWPKLTDADKTYLRNNDGCTYCQCLKVGHTHVTCPKKAEVAKRKAASQQGKANP